MTLVADLACRQIEARSRNAILAARQFTSGLLDLFPGATAAYSLRRLAVGYLGAAVNVRRSSDNATRDIGFGSGGDFDSTAFSAFVGVGSGFVTRWYDQSGHANDLTQATTAKQYQLVLSDSQTGKPALHAPGTAPGGGQPQPATTGMSAADNASYKTAIVHGFVACRMNHYIDNNQATDNWILGYPLNTSASGAPYSPTAAPWAFVNYADASLVQCQVGSNYSFGDGAGQWSRDAITVWEFNTNTGNLFVNNSLLNTQNGAASVSYTNAVGLYLGMAGDGNTNMDGDFAEVVLYGSTQAARASIAANQIAYWGIVNPSSTFTTADGFVWGARLSNAHNTIDTIGGWNYGSEGAYDSYSFSKCANNLGGNGDFFRYELRQWDTDNITGAERCEIDGYSAQIATFVAGVTMQVSFAIYVEAGDPVNMGGGGWCDAMQVHLDNAGFPPDGAALGWAYNALFTGSISGTTLTASSPSHGNILVGARIYGTTGGNIADVVLPNTTILSQLTGTTGQAGTYQVSQSQVVTSRNTIAAADVFSFDSNAATQATFPFSRSTWYDIFFELTFPASGNDTYLAWVNGVQVANVSALLEGSNAGLAYYAKSGIYSGNPGIPQTRAIRVANFEVSNKATTDISSRIASPLAHPTHA